MKRILTIFRKDATHLWPQIAVFEALLAMAAIFDPTYSQVGADSYYWVVGELLLPVACAYLAISVVHQERLIGDRQYWLTRPFSWKDLLLAKLLFVAAFVTAPILLSHIAVLAALGLSPLHYAPLLIWKAMLFAAVFVLPAVALAAITRNLGQVVLALLLVVAPALFIGPWLLARSGRWNHLDSMLGPQLAGILALVMTAVLVLQYSGRRTTLSRLILVGSVLLAAVGPNLISADQTPGARATVTRDQPDFAKISLRADVRAARANPLWREFTELQVPVQVEGMPPGGSLFVNSIEAYLDIPGRTARPFSATWVPDSAVGIQLDPVTFNGVKSTTLDLRVLLEFTVFGNPRDLPIPKDRREAVPGIGVCADRRNAFNSIEFVCYTPSPRVSLRVNMPGAAPNWIVPRGSAEQSLPASPEFQLISRFTSQLTYGKWDELQGASMHTEEPLAHIRRSLTVSQIRLQDLQPPPPFFPSDWKKWRDEQAKKRRDKK